MKKVAVLTDFSSPDSSYSLNIVAETQLRMLLNAGYEPVGIVEDGFQPERVWSEVELRRIASADKYNRVISPPPDNWEEQISEIRMSLNAALEGIDVVITHDMIYQAASLCLNHAARQYAKEHPHVFWLNWIHSASASPVWNHEGTNTHFPNSKTVYPNAYSIPRVAFNFKCEVDDVAFVPHGTDLARYFGLDEITERFARERLLFEAEAIIVYPVRLDRGKQVEYVIRTGAAIKRLRRSARVVVIDFHSTGGDKVQYRQSLRNTAIDVGLNEIELSFTSEFDEAWRVSVPRDVVRNLLLLSNVFMLPSRSETYSLVAQEAALLGNFLILNQDFPPMRSIYGDKPAYFQFSSNIDALSGRDGETNTEYGDIDAYFRDVALRALYEIENNPVLAMMTWARKERNLDAVFRKHLEPLLHARDG